MKKFLTTLCIGFEKDEDSIVKQALLLSINLHSNGNTRFYSNIMELAKSYKLPDFVPNNLDKTKISRCIEDITRWLEDMNFMFEWQTQYLTSERSSLVRYCVCHENIKFISSSQRVMFFLLFGDKISEIAHFYSLREIL